MGQGHHSSNGMKRTRLVAVGALSIDNILTVPHYPEEDAKLRATSLTKRRGGNTPNTFEVLRQSLHGDCNADPDSSCEKRAMMELLLVVTLPARDSTHIPFIASSFDRREPNDTSQSTTESPESRKFCVDLSNSIYREDFDEPISSYILSSNSNSSRTIITHNVLPEMTFTEFVDLTKRILDTSDDADSDPVEQYWFHFEGRIPETTLECMRYLRRHNLFKRKDDSIKTGKQDLMISCEIEKPARDGLQELAYLADVIVYSKAWAQGQGHQSAESCLNEQARFLSAASNSSDDYPIEQTLICPWGDRGAYARDLSTKSSASHQDDSNIISSPAYVSDDESIVDATGAGDTFIAGVLFGLICRAHGGHEDSKNARQWSLSQTLAFANGLAGRKILQHGFHGLGEAIQDLKNGIDAEGSRLST